MSIIFSHYLSVLYVEQLISIQCTYVHKIYCNIYLVWEQPFIVCQDLDVSLSLFTVTPLKTITLSSWTCLSTVSLQHCFTTHGCTMALLTADWLDLLVTHAYILAQSTPEPSHRTLTNLGLLSLQNNLGGGGGGGYSGSQAVTAPTPTLGQLNSNKIVVRWTTL